jgi:hypothetical protein
MKKGVLIALLCTVALVAASKNSMGRNNNDDYSTNGNKNRRHQQAAARGEMKPFRTGNEYTYEYGTQVATGMVASETSADPGMPQQKAVTRMYTQTKIQFQSDRHATLQLEQIRLGQLNDQIPQPVSKYHFYFQTNGKNIKFMDKIKKMNFMSLYY